MNNVLKFVLAGGLGLALTSCGTQKKVRSITNRLSEMSE